MKLRTAVLGGAAAYVGYRLFTKQPIVPTSLGIVPSGTPTPSGGTTTGSGGSTGGGTPLASGTTPVFIVIPSTAGAQAFNSFAKAGDVAMYTGSNKSLLGQTTIGTTCIGYDSWATAQTDIPSLPTGVTMAAYDPEHWTLTPAVEQANLPATAAAFYAFAHARGMLFTVVPDQAFDRSYAGTLAQSADVFIIQGESVQSSPSGYSANILPFRDAIKAGNAQCKVYSSVSVARPGSSSAQALAALATVMGGVDGVAIYCDANSVAAMQATVLGLRGP